MTEVSSIEAEPTPDFGTRFTELVAILDGVREQLFIAEQPDRFAVHIHPTHLPTSPEVIAAERSVIEHVMASELPFDTQAQLLMAVGLCNQIPTEKEYLEKSGLTPGATVERLRVKQKIQASNALFLLRGPDRQPQLRVGISYSLQGVNHMTLLDSHAQPVSPVELRIST